MPASGKHEQAFSAVLTLEENSAAAIRFIPRAAAHPGFQFHHIPELDGFRGVAITLVIAGQLLEYHSASAEARDLALSMARVGVLLFFVLSGFLITGVRCRERSVTGSVDRKLFGRTVARPRYEAKSVSGILRANSALLRWFVRNTA